MKTLILTLAVAAVMAWAAGSLLAAEGAAATGTDSRAPAKAEAKAPMARWAEQAGLTDQQKEQIKAILAAARDEAQKAPDMPAKIQIFADALEKIRTTVLTDEQRAKLGDLQQAVAGQVMGRLQGIGQQLGLTPEQIEAAKKIMQAATEAAKQAPDVPAKMKIMQDAMEQIRTTVLTDEQRAQMDQARQQMEQTREKMKERRAQQTQAEAPKE